MSVGGRSQVQAPCLLVASLLTIGGREDGGRGGLWGKKEAEGAVCPSAPLIVTSWASGCFWETRLGKKLSV